MGKDIKSTALSEAISQAESETGARVVTLGEAHNYVQNIKLLRDSLPALVQSGHTTLYLEVGADQQRMVEDALGGDAKAQRELRLKYERWWGFYSGTEGAQERYDMLFDAKKAGLRVICVDMDNTKDHAQRYSRLVEDEQHQALSARLGIADARIASNIRQVDDGQKGILLVGLSHTYKAAPGGHIEVLDGGEEVGYYQSQHGGANERLNAAGIPTTSIDFTGVKGASGQLEKGNGRSNDYKFLIEEEPYNPDTQKYHFSTGYRVYWDRLADVYDEALVTEKDSLRSQERQLYTKTAQDLRGLSRMLDDPAFLRSSPEVQEKRLTQAILKIDRQVDDTLMTLQDDTHLNAAFAVQQLWLRKNEAQDPEAATLWRRVAADNRALHAPEASAMWLRPAATSANSPAANGYAQAVDLTALAAMMPATEERSAKAEPGLAPSPVLPKAPAFSR